MGRVNFVTISITCGAMVRPKGVTSFKLRDVEINSRQPYDFVEQRAARLLGLTTKQAKALFSPDGFRNEPGTPEYVEEVVKRISIDLRQVGNHCAVLRFDRRKHPKNGSFKEFEERGVLSGVHFTASGTAAAWNRAQPTMR